MSLFQTKKAVFVLIFVTGIGTLLCSCRDAFPYPSEIADDYEQYQDVFVRVAENELFSKEGHTRIIYSDYDKSNEDLVFIFDRLGYAEIYDFGGGAYFNKFNSIFDFAGLVYYRKSQKNINHAAPFYCEFLDDNEQWEYQNTMLSPR